MADITVNASQRTVRTGTAPAPLFSGDEGGYRPRGEQVRRKTGEEATEECRLRSERPCRSA